MTEPENGYLPKLEILTWPLILQIDRCLADIAEGSGEGALHIIIRRGLVRFLNKEQGQPAKTE